MSGQPFLYPDLPEPGQPLRKYPMLIGGQWLEASTGDWLTTADPYTTQPWALIPRGAQADVDRAVDAARQAFRSKAWGGISASARGAMLNRLADLIEQHAAYLGRLETQDNGKLLVEMTTQLRYLPQWFRYYGGIADKIEGAVLPSDRLEMFNYTRREPLGVIAAITPWNSPLLLATWKIAPALAAGNTVVLKPSEHSSVSALELARLFELAGFPPGVFNVVTGLGPEVGEPLVRHPDVAKIAFTGGDFSGQRVYELAAQGIKPVTLELGGKSANLVFADADLDSAVNGVISGIFAASGQTCLAGSRALVHRSLYDSFIDKLVATASQAVLGNPVLPATQVGPVTTPAQLDKVLGFIQGAKAEGARCVMGGARPDPAQVGDGWFVQPTVFADVTPTMTLFQEEVFGPVLAVTPFDTEEEAVALANGTRYGLAAGVWTRDMGRAIRTSHALEAGTVWVNAYRVVSYLSPFGGYKRSGIGRESGAEMVMEYMQTKSVWVNTGGGTANPFSMR
jgi:acyl-CoA reductase-like NAD-dependent aldehyde dehydrogenase